MRIINKKFKFILFGFAMFFLGYFSLNYIDGNTAQINTNSNIKIIRNRLDPNANSNQESNFKNDYNKDNNKHKMLNKNKDIKNSNNNNINNADNDDADDDNDDIDEDPQELANKADLLNENNSLNDTQVKRYLAYDGGGFGSINDGIVKCSDNIEILITGSSEKIKEVDFSYFHMNAPEKVNLNKNKKQYTMVYTMESEVHSYGGESWSNADFRMWYNLDRSFPEPATYFDVKAHLVDLLNGPKVEFNKKETTAPIVWVVSNCAAYNGREKFIKQLMKSVEVHSYGGCLKNKHTHPSEHMKGNIELFSRYKFVIAIENSNCEDYVTEKLVHAVASGSIPIVAGKDNKPNYLRFMPKNSYINIYDYETVDDLVKQIKKIESSDQEYEKYIHFKLKHNYTRQYLNSLSLSEVIELSKTVIGYENEKEFFDSLIAKEKSENKLCKIARYLKNTPVDKIETEINKRRAERPDSATVCLKRGNLANDFKIK